ncbi:MAG: lysylphosphatidylglycerol synthase transmembrane domain-containing protein [Microgenomates group bacterium]
MFNRLISSKWTRLLFSVVLIFLAFRKVDIIKILGEISAVPWWFVVAMVFYVILTSIMGGVRWSWLVLEETTMKDYWNFTRATYLGGFYSLFFPSAVAGDMIKWLPLLKTYPELSKTKLAASVIIDRVVGLSAFVVIGFAALLSGKALGYVFPDMLLWLFGGLFGGVIIFFLVVFYFDFEGFYNKYFSRFKFLHKLVEVMEILYKGNRRRIRNCFLLSLIGEPFWMMPFWFYSLIFGAGISLLQIFIFVPVIALTLVLPISIAGFGARESLFLFFLAPLGHSPEKILLVSTFGGLIGIINSLIGGLLILIK